MRTVVTNTLLNMGAFGLSALIQLVQVPATLAWYGVHGLGVLALVRLLMPIGITNALDLGLPIVATRSVARLTALDDRGALARHLGAAAALAFAVGAAVGAAMLAIGPDRLGDFLRIDPADRPQFAAVLAVIALASPPLFVGTTLQGGLEGWEDFRTVRMGELGTALAFLAATVAGGLGGWSLHALATAFVAIHLLKVVWFAAVTLRRLRGHGGARVPGWRDVLRRIFGDIRVFALVRLTGMISAQVTPLLIAAFSGPSGLGVFDALQRLPRLLKLVVGLASSTVAPVSVRLHALRDAAGARQLVLTGNRMTAAISVPIAAVISAFAGWLLHLWLGPAFDGYAPALAAGIAWILVGTFSSLIAAASVAEIRLVRIITIVSWVELAALAGGVALAVPRWGVASAFYVLAALALFSYAVRTAIYLPAYAIRHGEWHGMILRILIAGGLPPFAVAGAMQAAGLGPSWWALVPGAAVAGLASIGAIYLAWPAAERRQADRLLGTVADTLLRRRGGRAA